MIVARTAVKTISTRYKQALRRNLSSSVHLIQPTVGSFVALEHPLNSDLIPHVGLCTLTFIQDGSVIHQDSSSEKEQLIEPEEVSWLVTGKGVVSAQHSSTEEVDGWKLWIALPKKYEKMEPAYYHSPSIVEIPNPRFDTEVRLLVGKLWGREQRNIPLLPGMKDLFVLTVEFKTNSSFWTCPQAFPKDAQVGIYVTSGKIQLNDDDTTVLESGDLHVWNNTNDTDQKLLDLQGVLPDSRCIIFGGSELPEPRYLKGSLCSSDQNKLDHDEEFAFFQGF
mmetsp:Transcript_1583/g.2176  ORF Transcript_1583/g.2176 Transcript_1583/m.2176 type:complete len:279 (+) Transcript_1583:104-940(+)|eukprot:CAMPEP_0178924758 /NCGR_PEP_ID=MMETSP0786-20121207/17508_1 /TAXON_ID=186022 /ORGANISM="Thalassionema frauenfeldii, Strain CCMP 1798" /LENGTH=278 /DNA_ID=CAMNT_0020599511 /DNA_START=24 /DNA_END=860 /DNA_ORIENTATION=-